MKQLVMDHQRMIVLLAILVVGALSFISLAGNKPYQLGIGIITTVAYVGWGIVHHSIEGDLYPKVVVEYLLIGTIALVVLLTVFGF